MPVVLFELDKYIAPGVSAFTQAEIPDMSTYASRSQHWVSDFFLNTFVRSEVQAPYRAYLFNYLRRSEAAFCEHALARTATIEYLASVHPSPGRHSHALFHWEIFVGQASNAFEILRNAFRFGRFKPGDDTVEERLHELNNQMRHVESRIACGQMLDEATLPVWLTNSGLQSTNKSLSYTETAEILKDIAKWADVFKDPLTAREKFESWG